MKRGGPQTSGGKTVSSANSVKHGLLSEKVLMRGEKSDELMSLSTQLYGSLLPEGAMEGVLVDRIVSSIWRLRRLIDIEPGNGITSNGDGIMYDADKFFRYETMLERGIYKAMHELERMQARRQGQIVPLPVTGDISIDDSRQFVS